MRYRLAPGERELFRPVLSVAVLEEARRNLVADGRCSAQRVLAEIARREGRLGRVSAAVSTELATVVLVKAASREVSSADR